MNNIQPRKVFTPQELALKSDPIIISLLELSFEYMLAGIAEAHMKAKGFRSITEFNEKNELQRPLLLAYPFFVSLANGHGKSLYSLFGDFMSYTYGPASQSVKDLIPLDRNTFGNKPTSLKYFQINSYKVQVKDNAIQNFGFIKEKLKEVPFGGYANMPTLQFGEVGILSDADADKKTSLCYAIDRGIELVKTITHGDFFDGSTKKLLDFSMYFDAWRSHYEDNTIEVINFDSITPSNRQQVYGSSALNPA